MKVWRETSEQVVIEDKVYPVTPPSMTVKTGMITGEVIELKVTERVEKGSERVVSPARLTGKLRLENTSANRTVRLVEGKLLFIDAQGQRIKLDAARTDPIVKFSTYGNERLDSAAMRAIDIGARTYGSVKSILANNLDRRPSPKRSADDAPILHPNIRGAGYYN